MTYPTLDERLVRNAFLQALEGGKKIHRKTLVKHIADEGAIPPAGVHGRTESDYKELDLILGEMMLEGLIKQNRAFMCQARITKD